MTGTFNVKVFQNVSTDERGRPLGVMDGGFCSDHRLRPVAGFVGVPAASQEEACELALNLLDHANEQIGPEWPELNTARREWLRGYMVGDVVSIVEGDTFSIEPVGLRKLDADEWFDTVVDEPTKFVQVEVKV